MTPNWPLKRQHCFESGCHDHRYMAAWVNGSVHDRQLWETEVGWSTANQPFVTGSSVPKAEVQEASPDLQRADNQRSF